MPLALLHQLVLPLYDGHFALHACKLRGGDAGLLARARALDQHVWRRQRQQCVCVVGRELIAVDLSCFSMSAKVGEC